jgi:DNA-binding MarR family transcriptional regulator
MVRLPLKFREHSKIQGTLNELSPTSPRFAFGLYLPGPSFRFIAISASAIYSGNSSGRRVRTWVSISSTVAGSSIASATIRNSARLPGLNVSALLRLLNITKQSLARVIDDLAERDLVESQPGFTDRRQRRLTLTASGTQLERSLFQDLRGKLGAAYAGATAEDVAGFWRVLEGLVPEEEKDVVLRLEGN